MSTAKQHKSKETLEYLKLRFDAMKLATHGRSNRLSSPFSDKNKSQRQRLSVGFNAMGDNRMRHETQMIMQMGW